MLVDLSHSRKIQNILLELVLEMVAEHMEVVLMLLDSLIKVLLSHNTTYDFDYLSDIALNIWKDDSRLSASDKTTATSDLDSSNISISYSRIIRKYISKNVFFDAGLGISIHNNESMNGSDLGSIYQFENRLGIGYERETYRSVLNIFHYSNGGLEGKNDGVDILMLSVSKYF